MKNKKLFYVFLTCTPILFFFANELIIMLFPRETNESILIKIVSAIIIGYSISFGLWYLDRKNTKK